MTKSLIHHLPKLRKLPIMMWAVFLFSIQIATGQTMFQRHYGGGAYDSGSEVIQTSDGGYLVVASTESYGAGNRDIYLLRTNEFGDTVWTKTIGGSDNDQANALKVTNDNCYIIVGSTNSKGAGDRDVFLLKVNQDGDTIWTKTFGGIYSDTGYDVIQTSDGGYIVVGGTLSFTSGISSAYAIRTNSDGDTLWTKYYEKKNVNTASSVIQMSDGGFFIVGQTLLSSQGNSADAYLIRTNISGDTLWTKTYGGSDWDGAFCTSSLSDGNLIISGTTVSYGSGGCDIFLSMLNSSGVEIWMKTFGGSFDDYGGAFSKSNDGGYIISGYTESFGVGNQDMYLIKTDQNGDTLWTKTFGDFGNEWGASVKQVSDNGFVISGNSDSFGNGYDVYLVKTNSLGFSCFDKVIQQKIDCLLFPNPNSGAMEISYFIPEEETGVFELYDLSGRIIVSKELNGGTNVVPITIQGLENGLYYYRAFTPYTNIKNGRVVIIK